MSAVTQTLPAPLTGGRWSWLPAALLGLAAWGALFHAEAAAAFAVWLKSTAYSHCFFVVPLAAYLAWDRRGLARGLAPRPTPWPALAVLPCALAWFAAERLGIMEGRQLAAVAMLQALGVALLGWRLARVQWPALAYLIFLVPFGSFLVPDLQAITAWCVDVGLELLDIPHVVDAFTIEIPEGTFYVAEACAGLRFLIAAVAFGALYGLLTYRSPWRRLAFLVASIVVPILANGIRALGIVVAGHILGDAEAAAADHLIYGWIFFSIVILLLTAAGLPFREDTLPPAPVVAPAPGQIPGRGFAAAGAVIVAAALAPLFALWLDQPAAAPALALPGFVASPGCQSVGDPPGTVMHFSCGGDRLAARVTVLPPRASPALMRAARSAATGERDAADAVTSTLALDLPAAPRWRVVELGKPDRMIATAAWIHGAPDAGGLAGRLRMAWDSVAGGAPPVVLVAAALEPASLRHTDDREAARRVLRDFLGAQGALFAAVAGVR